MPLVIWKDYLIIGSPEIGHYHKQLIEQLNTLVNPMLANCGKEEIKGIVDFLDLYTAQKFEFEDFFSQRYKCPVASNNAAAHTKFIKALSEVKQELQIKGWILSSVIKLNEQLLDWFVNHIKKFVRELNSYMSKP
ncbi:MULTISPECIES: hemerythrin domain-containing protein [unclassified Microcoleus]|uniref:hemerythrin domain-containing protein n=1 Tax=unclassified Microcoleus TaxID=2642155 RepID=UPI002FD2824F